MFTGLEAWRTIFSGVALLSIAIAFFSLRVAKYKYKEESEMSHDKEVIAQAKLSLEWAFEALEYDSELKMPKPDRLMWLTSARHILRYYELRDSLKTKIYKTICAEHEEYWRHKFYLMFSNPNFMFGSYFTDSSKPGYPENIELRSAMVLSVFSQWNETAEDPIDAISKQSLVSKEPYRGRMGQGLEHYQKILEDSLEKLG